LTPPSDPTRERSEKRSRSAIDLAAVARELERIREIKQDGSVAFNGLRYPDLVALLPAAIHIPEEITDGERTQIASSALREAAREKTISPSGIEAAVARAIEKHRAIPRQPFIVITSIAARFDRQIERRILEDGRIAFSRQPRARFNRDHAAQLLPRGIPIDFPGFAHVQVRVSERTSLGAFERGIDTLDYLRACWNLFFNKSLWFRSTQGFATVNIVRPGPVHTVHNLDGTPATPIIWLEPYFGKPPEAAILSGKWAEAQRFERRIRRAVRRCPYGKSLRKVLLLYCRACDNVLQELTFLQLWAVLEALTATVGTTHDQTIDRTATLFPDPDLERGILHHLLLRRNESVHQGLKGFDVSSDALRLHRYAVALLMLHLQSVPLFKSLQEVGDFLKLPRDRQALLRGIALRKLALKWRRGASTAGSDLS
jgi:hypothetical protein